MMLSKHAFSQPLANALRQLTVDELSRHRLLALAISRGWLDSDASTTSRAHRRLLENAKRESVVRSLLTEIAAKAHGIEIGLLKGAALWGDLYEPGEREAADLDLYVRAADLETVLQTLFKCGFVSLHRSQSRAANFKTLCLSPLYGDLSVEIHTKLWWREPTDFKWRWRTAQRAPFTRLEIEDQFIHLCGHWVAQHTMLSLHWLVDIALFLETYGKAMDQGLLVERSSKVGLTRAVAFASTICEDLLVQEKKKTLAGIDFDFLRDPRKNLARYFLIKHRVQDSWLDAFRYDLDWIGTRLRGEA